MSNGYKKYLKNQKKYNFIILITQISIIISFFVIWQILSDKKIINTFLVSNPKNIINTIINLIKENNFFNHIFITLYEIIISFIIGNIIGIIVSTILWFSKFLNKVFDPFFTILNSLPKVAFGPLIIVWSGANIKSIIFMSLLISTTISIISITNYFKNTDINKINLLKSMGSNKFQIFRYVVFPSNLKYIFNSFKINLSMSFVGVIMGELLVSKEGIGYLIIYGSQVFNMNIVMCGIILLVIMTVILYCIINYIIKIFNKN